jgi:alpha-mannosidase
VVYNPLPWKRDGEIELDTRLIFGSNFVSLKPVDGGSNIVVSHEYPSIEDKAPMSRFVVKDIPPMGYRAYIASDEKVEPPEMNIDLNSGVIESPFFKAVLDAKQGRITSLIDKRRGKELVDASAPQGFGQYLYERFGYKQIYDWIARSLYPQYNAHKFIFAAYDMPQDVDYSSSLSEGMTLTLEKSSIDVKAVMTGIIPGPGQPQEVTISLTLSGIMPVADLKVSWQKQPDTWPEAAWFCLPFKCDNPEFRLGRLGADVDPRKDMVVDNANYHLWWVNNGVSVYDGASGSGIGICSVDAPLVSLGEPGEYKFDKRYEPEKPYIYLNLYNNHWRTNFPSWIGNGQRMSARVRIWTYDKFNTESSLYTPAMEARVPLLAATSKVKNGKLSVTQSGISISRKGVALSAFGPNPDGEGKILRLWEHAGITGKIEVTLPADSKFVTAVPVNLRGEKSGDAVKISDGKISFYIHAYAPVSFILKEQEK